MNLIVLNDLTPSISETSEEAKAQILQAAALIGVVKNPEMQNRAVQVIANGKQLLKGIEDARVSVKAPYLKAGQEIDRIAKEFSQDISAELVRISQAVNQFQAEQERIRRQAEADREAEAQRIKNEENERLAEIERQKQLVEIQARAAQLKLEEEAKKATSEAELERIGREHARIEEEREQYREQAEQLTLQHAENEARRLLSLPVVAAPVLAPGQKSDVEFVYEVTDIHALYRENPGMVRLEENKAEIKAAIKRGVRSLAGVRIFPAMKTTVRAGKDYIQI